MSRYRIYLSGPMTGLPDYNYPAFNRVAYELRAAAWNVINPAEHFDGRTDLPRQKYMRKDIESLLEADAVGTLPGWEDSKGATLEVSIARELGMPVFAVNDLLTRLGQTPVIVPRPPKHSPEESPAVEAERLVNGDRQADYGHPLDDFTKTALIWTAILGTEVTPEQVALCMVGVKISREVNRPKRDNLVDGIGYFTTLWMVGQERARRARDEE